MASNKLIRVVTRAADGSLRTRDHEDFDGILEIHDQIGIDDCSTDLSLRGLPLFRGLVGPLSESSTVVRYESPDVFESLTKEWSLEKTKRRRRRKSVESTTTSAVPAPKLSLGPTTGAPAGVPNTVQ